MARTESHNEQDLLELRASGKWPAQCDEELRLHVRECAVCADLVLVAGALLQDGQELWRTVSGAGAGDGLVARPDPRPLRSRARSGEPRHRCAVHGSVRWLAGLCSIRLGRGAVALLGLDGPRPFASGIRSGRNAGRG